MNAATTKRKTARNAKPTRNLKPAAKTETVGQLPFYVVGIGASAGGLEAFRLLLQSLPVDSGLAYVIVQHLSSTHKSLLPNILSRETKMPVVAIKNGMSLKADHVFVVPENSLLSIEAGVFRVKKISAGTRALLPIDSFFKSLAADQKENAIGIVLSGAGADGAHGTKAIKSEGGFTFAQAPESAQHPSMPVSAIRIDDIDFILSPREIARELANFQRPPVDASDLGEGFNEILQYLKRKIGTDFFQYKQNTLHRRVTRRLVINKLTSFTKYLKLLKSNPTESAALAEDILINVTQFFREPESLELLSKQIFPALLKREEGRAIRIWVPGCATGEEAYSIAILLWELAEKCENVPKIQIFATDLSNHCIEKARAGKYVSSIAAQMPPEYLKKYFIKKDLGYQVQKQIRDLCVFAKHDLTRDPPYTHLDLISCRNVFIYFGSVLQNRLLETFHYSLTPTGHLLLGQSENIGTSTDLFSAVDAKRKVYEKRSVVTTHKGSMWSVPLKGVDTKVSHVAPDSQLAAIQMQVEIDRTLLNRFTPPAVVINGQFDILQFRGNTEPYLVHKAGEANLSLLKMLKDNLGSEVRDLVNKVKKKGEAAKASGFHLLDSANVIIEVSEITLLGNSCFLVTFQRPGLADFKPRRGEKGKGSTELRRLSSELSTTKNRLNFVIQDLENTNQELQSANEEVISANEELQSTNEELETSKEELQSINEELNTVNDELQNRNQDLFVLNNDLVNLLNSIYIPVIIVGNDLTIRRFTPTASNVLNVKIGDVGRPITDITSNSVDLKLLIDAIRHVIDTATVFEREFVDSENRWHQLRVRPYKTQDQKIDGAVVTLLDIDQFKKKPTP